MIHNIDLQARYLKAGFSFFHFSSTDKSHLRSMPWRTWQERKPTQEDILTWAKHPIQNYAIVCGKISNLIVIDVDTKNGGNPGPFQNRGFYEVRTPSGGYHFYVLYDPILSSTKQSRRRKGGILTAVDIQSDRTIVFAPPSKFIQGGYTIVNDAPLIPIPDDLLAQILSDLEPEEEKKQYKPYIAPSDPASRRPGDIFNALASWEDVLTPIGWTRVGHARNGVEYWRRPGKKDHGISASTNYKGYNLFFPYSTETEFDTLKGYTKFHVYALTRHNGDFKKAAVALVMENYKLANKLV